MTDLRAQLQATLGDAYTIERELGGGGMSRVFLASEHALRRKVVIKVLPSEATAALSVERFKREIRFAATLQQANIVPVLNAGEAGGVPFYTMPYVEGESLRARLAAGGQFPVPEAVGLLKEIARALSHAHSKGVVHRDIKPDNVLLSGGSAMVTDFGIAKALQESTATPGGTLTGTGTTLGTPAYMAPEQASGEADIDHRADIYAFGCLAYEMLTGAPPFTGPSIQAVIAAHLTKDPAPIASRRDKLPKALGSLVSRCLAKDPAARPQSAIELVYALDELAAPTPQNVPFSAARLQRGPMVAAAFVIVFVLVAAIGGLAMYAVRPPAAYATGRSTAVVSTAETIELEPAISPDGRFVAYVVGTVPTRRIEVRQIGGERRIKIAENLEADQRWPRWSPDGTTLLFSGGQTLYVVNAFGGQPRPLAEATAGTLTSDWSPRGDAVVYASGDSLWVRPLSGGTATPLSAKAREMVAPAWSPDGRFVAVTSRNSAYIQSRGNIAPSSIWIVPVDGGDPWPVTDSTRLNFGAVWTPDGRNLLFVSDREGTRDIYQLPLNRNGRPSGAPIRVSSGLNAGTISLDATGTRLGYSVLLVRRNVWSAAILPGRESTLADAIAVTSGNQAVEGVSVSRDGRWLVFDSNRQGNEDVFKLDLAAPAGTAEPIALTSDPADDFLARLSPDGREVVFYSTRAGSRDVFVMKADGRDAVRITDDPSGEVYPDWSPDGRSIVFGTVTRGIGIAERGGDGAWMRPQIIKGDSLSCARGAFPRWSPDGAVIALPCDENGLLLVTPDGRTRRLIPVPGVNVGFVEWDPLVPTTILVKARPTGEIWRVSVSTGRAQRIFRIDNPERVAPRQEFASDGRRLFFTLSSDEADVWVMELTRKH